MKCFYILYLNWDTNVCRLYTTLLLLSSCLYSMDDVMTGEKKSKDKIDIFDLQTELQFQMKSADVVEREFMFPIHYS